MSGLRVVAVDVTSTEPAQEAVLHGGVEVHNASQRERWGDGGRLTSIEHERSEAADETSASSAYAVLDGPDEAGPVVGWATVDVPLRDNPDLAWLHLVVHPEHRRRGAAGLLLGAAEDVARDARRILVGSSSVPVGQDDPAEPLAARHGYVVGQEIHRNTMELTRDEAERARLEALAAGGGTGPDGSPYRVDVALDAPPEHWWAGMAEQYRRISTDAPAGDIPYGEEDWDADRVRAKTARALAAGAHLAWAAAFAPDGTMVALTEIETNPTDPATAQQDTTLVLREHRGHRLGLRVKAANALQVLDRLPQVRRVTTWNAVDNGPMIATNTALGYRATGRVRQWTKDLRTT